MGQLKRDLNEIMSEYSNEPPCSKNGRGGGEERISSLEGITTNSLRTALLHRGDTL
jgi:hypothetical protein